MRLPVVPQISTKDGVSNKNARLTNCLKESKKGGDKAVVRPGLVLDAQASGVGNGLVVFNNELVSVYGTTLGFGVGEELSSWAKINSQTMLGRGSVANNGTTFLQSTQSTTDGATWTTGLGGTIDDVSIIAIGSDFYGLISGGGQLQKSSDNGATWTYVADFPGAGGGGQIIWYAGNATMRLYWYDIDTFEMWRSSDLGGSWTERFPSSPPSSSQCVSIQVGTTLYLFDGVNGIYETSTNFQDFSSGALYSTQVSIGYYLSGYFYAYNFSDGNVVKISTSDMSNATILGYVPLASDPGSYFYRGGQPFKIGPDSYIFGLDGVFKSSAGIPALATIATGLYDFAQSPL